MKKLLLIPLFLILTSLNNDHHNFFIKNRKVEYIKVFDTDSTVTDTNILNFISTINGFSLNVSNPYFITGRINGVKLDFEKFGFRAITNWTAFAHPMYCNVRVNIKKNKYKITLTNINFAQPNFSGAVNAFIKKDGKSWRERTIFKNAKTLMDSCFTDMFSYRNVEEW